MAQCRYAKMKIVILSRKSVMIAAVTLALASVGGWVYWRRSAAHEQPRPSNQYVDSALCVDCHGGIAKTYKLTGMGRSFSRWTASEVDRFTGKAFHQEASDSYFAMVERGGKVFQRRWQMDAAGKETNVDEKQVDYVIGSGNHARTYLHLTNRNTLQVLPLSWYSEKGGSWAMSPGYDHPDFPGSVRPIHYECIFCHNAYPKIPEGDAAEVTFSLPLPEGIDCQRCHGPGQQHVDLASEGAPVEQVRAAIVNPKRLSPEREIEVCLQCHLETTSRALPHAIRRVDRGPFSYIPGEPLGKFRVEFRAEREPQPAFEIAHAAYRLMESKCFLKSGEKLRCTTCHDPHDIPRGEAAEARYNNICMNCHQSLTSRADLSPAHKSGAGCIGCHMPKRRTDDVVHVAMTDHLIQRIKPPGNLLAEKSEKPESAETAYRGGVIAYYPANLPANSENSIMVGIAQVRDQSNLQEGLPRLVALVEQQHPSDAGYYADLAQGYRFAGERERAIQYYQMAADKAPSPIRFVQLGNALMEAARWPEAEAALRRATALAPGEPVGWGTLGWVLWQENKAADGRAALEKAIEIDPELPELRNNLGSVLWGTGDRQGALTQFREALRIQPGVAEWRLNLARLLAVSGNVSEALVQFAQSVRLKPALTEARIDYARLLGDTNHSAEAERQAAEAIRAEPNSAAGHEVLGSLLVNRGDVERGIRELESAIAIQSEFGRAQFELGIALGRKGDNSRAIEHLRRAAAGRDPEASAAAKQVLAQVAR